MQTRKIGDFPIITFRRSEVFTPDGLIQESFKLAGNVIVVAYDLKKLAKIKERFNMGSVRALFDNPAHLSEVLARIKIEAQDFFGANPYQVYVILEEA